MSCKVNVTQSPFWTLFLRPHKSVKRKHPDYKLKRFKIYRTDSLEKPSQKQIWDYSHSAFLEEQEEVDAVKNKKLDFVVGNPPWGGILKREKCSSLH